MLRKLFRDATIVFIEPDTYLQEPVYWHHVQKDSHGAEELQKQQAMKGHDSADLMSCTRLRPGCSVSLPRHSSEATATTFFETAG